MHTVGARLRARAALSSTGERVRVRRRCFSILDDRPAARSLPPRPRRRNRSGCVGAATNAPAVTRRSSTHENPRAAAVTNADFPRVLNGPAPGFAEDALRRLLIGSLPGEGGSLTEIGYGKVASGRASVGAAARGGIGCGAGGGGGGGSSGAVFPRVFHDEGVSSSSSPLSSSLSFEPSGAGGALDAAGDAAKDAAGETADDAAAAAAAAARHLEASRRTLGWRTGGDRRAEGLSGAERLHGGASLLREDEEEEEGSLDEGQQRQHVGGHLNGHANGYRDGRSNGHTNDHFTDQASQRRPRQAFSSAADVAEADDWEALVLDQEAQGEGGQGTEKEPLTYSTLWGMQLEREEQSHQEACDKYSKMLKDMMTMGKGAQMKPIEKLLTSWYPALKASIEAEQAAVWADLEDNDKKSVQIKGAFGGRNTYGPLLVMLKAEKQAVLVMHEVVNLILADGNRGVSTVKACRRVAELVQAEVNLMSMKSKGAKAKAPPPVSSRRHVREVNKKALEALDMLEYTSWPIGAQVKLGAALIKLLMETATWAHDNNQGGVSAVGTGEGGRGRGSASVPRAAFIHQVVMCKHKQQQGSLSLAPEVYAKMVDEDISRLAAPRFVPMLVQPRDWTQPDRGGFLKLHTQIMRTRGEAVQKQALRRADLTRVYQGLNCLGKVRWRINNTVLDTVLTCLADKIAVGDLPVGKDLPLPPVPEGVEVDERGKLVPLPKKVGSGSESESEEEVEARKKRRQKYYGYKRMVNKIKTKNANMHSLRCDMQIKVGIAEEFRDHVVYFPYNMDFRGRTYPIPPNLNILGSDFSRGVLVFDEAKPLGERGLYWLKVHLANLFGEDKVSFDDRVSFVEDSLDKVRDSALRPLDGDRWWMEADSPWQCLAVCKDLTAALDSPDPYQYLSCLPVHQDGSCNGLQHYAALGLDAKGGAQVNLVPSSKPQDVYTGVCDVVKKEVELQASTPPAPDASEAELEQQRIANLVHGLIDRKVVKQTVMTSVYGVTFVGARKQIQNVLEDKITKGTGVPSAEAEADVYRASAYVAKLTMKVLEELFTEARNIMEWLMSVSKLVAKEGQPMTWITPLGLPVLQPYRRKDKYQVQTLLQGVHIREDADDLPVAVKRQTSAFPPNFVHSLDSTHMLLTAIEMDEAGVPFAAVHDSYWVHAGHVDQMNSQLRQCFVDLYSGPVLEELHESIRMRYPTIEFPPIPARGSLKLEDVKDSEYFFN